MKKLKYKKIGLFLANLCLATYLLMAFCAWHKPTENEALCNTLTITVDDNRVGFVTKQEIATRLRNAKLYPVGAPLSSVSCRTIEEMLAQTPFVQSAECYKTIGGEVCIDVTQRLPILHVMASKPSTDDFYIDEQSTVMTRNQEYANCIIATGNISRDYAAQSLAPLVRAITSHKVFSDRFQQINITDKRGVELVPSIGNHIVYLGPLPEAKTKREQAEQIGAFVKAKLDRLNTFYTYGLDRVGWNKYSEINLQYSNQIICKQR